MSESKTGPRGPLDIARDLNARAEELDAEARTYLSDEDQSALLPDFSRVVDGLSDGHPYIAETVVIYGTPVTFSLDPEMAHPAAIAPAAESKPVTGSYRGLTIEKVHDPVRDVVERRLLHTVYVGSSPLIPDEFGNADQKHYYDYALAVGSEMIPTEPRNAHSLVDLRDDQTITRLDQIALTEDRDLAERLRASAIFTNRMIGECDHEAMLNHQRVSYLNSLGLLATAVLLTKDFVLGDKAHFESSSFVYISDRSTEVAILPDNFQITNGYDWVDGALLLGGGPELYVEGSLRDGQPAMAPIKGVNTYEAY